VNLLEGVQIPLGLQELLLLKKETFTGEMVQFEVVMSEIRLVSKTSGKSWVSTSSSKETCAV
jgi:hypothetical protein